MKLKLIKAKNKYKDLIIKTVTEWKKFNIENNSNSSPMAIFKEDVNDFDKYIKSLDIKKEENGLVPSSTYFVYDIEKKDIVGAINIRHYLNDYLYKYGGHIGLGVNPKYRNKGYGKKILSLAIEKCHKLKIKEILYVCSKDNIYSRKLILSFNGIYGSTVTNNNEELERYYIR